MRYFRAILSRLAGDRRGASALEFALVALPFFMIVAGSLDFGYQAYLSANVNGAVERAARRAAVGNQTRAQVVDMIRAEVREILPASSRDNPAAMQITPLSYTNFSNVGGGEPITGDTVPVGSYNSTDCYEDRNGNGRYDATNGGGDNLGTAEDIVFYTVIVSVPRLFPLKSTPGWDPTIQASARTLIRNQPFGPQRIVIRCS